MPELCRLHVYCDPTKRDWLGGHWQWGISRPEGWVLSLHFPRLGNPCRARGRIQGAQG